jgi:outer membrane protein OmpA-like peptidoglycan-associated protein
MYIERLKHICLASIVAAAIGLCSTGYAVDDVLNYSGKDPSKDELIDALMPPPSVKTRGISPGTIGAGGGAAGPSAAVPKKVSFDQITFELNSDRISPKARTLLDRLGQAIASDELTEVNFLIEGHTDATGALPYNMRLSSRRADAVRRYLVDNHQINPNRLRTAGKGPTDLLDKTHPDSGANRRVVFVPSESK